MNPDTSQEYQAQRPFTHQLVKDSLQHSLVMVIEEYLIFHDLQYILDGSSFLPEKFQIKFPRDKVSHETATEPLAAAFSSKKTKRKVVNT